MMSLGHSASRNHDESIVLVWNRQKKLANNTEEWIYRVEEHVRLSMTCMHVGAVHYLLTEREPDLEV